MTLPTGKLLVIGAVWPEPDSSAAGAHMMQVLRPLIREGWAVTFASTATDSPYAVDLSTYDIAIEYAKVNDPAFDALLSALQPDIVLFDRFFIEEQFGWRVEQQCPDALRILNCEDLHFLREARERSHRAGQSVEEPDLKNKVARREVAAILRSDLSLIISRFEIEVLVDTFQIDPELLHYCPFMIDPPTSAEQHDMPAFEDRRDFFSVGNLRHAPNWDGIQWLKTEIWPFIRKRLPEARLHLAGAYATQDQMAVHAPGQGFFMDGRIEDADARFRGSRICLAPLRFGAGLKGKLIDAMRNGTPSVTTPIGAEAMSDSMPWGGHVEGNAKSIAEAATRLYENRSDWERAQTRGFEILEKNFARDIHEPLLVEKISLARKNLAQRREQNFTGAMLRDHLHRSTRYLSLWIEAKNKLKSTDETSP